MDSLMLKVQVVLKEEFARIPGAKLHVKSGRETHEIKRLRSKLLEAYEKYGWGKSVTGNLYSYTSGGGLIYRAGENTPCEDADTWKVSAIDSLCAKWLYRLNEKSRAFATGFNAIYNLQHSTPFIALQIRLSDKKYEMDPHQCNFELNIRSI